MAALWGVTGGGTFWPKWVWFGLAIPFGLNAALFGAFHVRRRRWRVFAVHAALFSWVTLTLTLPSSPFCGLKRGHAFCSSQFTTS